MTVRSQFPLNSRSCLCLMSDAFKLSCQVLVMGLLSAFTSISYVGMLLILLFYLYGILCVTIMRDNDPVRWGSLEVAFVTLFEMATLEDWTDVMYTAMLGCNVYGFGFRQTW